MLIVQRIISIMAVVNQYLKFRADHTYTNLDKPKSVKKNENNL